MRQKYFIIIRKNVFAFFMTAGIRTGEEEKMSKLFSSMQNETRKRAKIRNNIIAMGVYL